TKKTHSCSLNGEDDVDEFASRERDRSSSSSSSSMSSTSITSELSPICEEDVTLLSTLLSHRSFSHTAQNINSSCILLSPVVNKSPAMAMQVLSQSIFRNVTPSGVASSGVAGDGPSGERQSSPTTHLSPQFSPSQPGVLRDGQSGMVKNKNRFEKVAEEEMEADESDHHHDHHQADISSQSQTISFPEKPQFFEWTRDLFPYTSIDYKPKLLSLCLSALLLSSFHFVIIGDDYDLVNFHIWFFSHFLPPSERVNTYFCSPHHSHSIFSHVPLQGLHSSWIEGRNIEADILTSVPHRLAILRIDPDLSSSSPEPSRHCLRSVALTPPLPLYLPLRCKFLQSSCLLKCVGVGGQGIEEEDSQRSQNRHSRPDGSRTETSVDNERFTRDRVGSERIRVRKRGLSECDVREIERFRSSSSTQLISRDDVHIYQLHKSESGRQKRKGVEAVVVCSPSEDDDSGNEDFPIPMPELTVGMWNRKGKPRNPALIPLSEQIKEKDREREKRDEKKRTEEAQNPMSSSEYPSLSHIHSVMNVLKTIKKTCMECVKILQPHTRSPMSIHNFCSDLFAAALMREKMRQLEQLSIGRAPSEEDIDARRMTSGVILQNHSYLFIRRYIEKSQLFLSCILTHIQQENPGKNVYVPTSFSGEGVVRGCTDRTFLKRLLFGLDCCEMLDAERRKKLEAKLKSKKFRKKEEMKFADNMDLYVVNQQETSVLLGVCEYFQHGIFNSLEGMI
ncbi:hypothetical protein ADUPG1_010982, partial [Aduncisulcus paluster]